MAEKKNGGAGEKKASSRRRSSSAGKQAAAGTRVRSGGSSGRAMTAEAIHQRNQVRAVVLFALAIFVGCLVLITGDNLWKWAHDAILGLFGGWAILWPVLMIYIAIITTLERPRGSLSGKVWLTGAIIVLFCAAGYVFGAPAPDEGMKFGEYIFSLYSNSSRAAGGVVGGLIGWPLRTAVGATGAKIIVILLLFVAIMLLTGTTLIGLFRTLKKPVDRVSSGIQRSRQRREEEREILEQERFDIDIPLEASSSSASPEVFALFSMPEKKRKKQPNEKLDRLKEVFNIEDGEDRRREPEPAAPAQQEEPAPKADAVPEEPALPEEPPQAQETALPEQQEETRPPEEEKREEPASPPMPDLASALREIEEEPVREAAFFTDEPRPTYMFPPVTMLAPSPQNDPRQEAKELETNGEILIDTLKHFGVEAHIVDISRGPAVTQYEIQPAAGVRVSKITGLSKELALALAATGVRIEAPIPGKAAVGIEVPNKTRTTVCMRELVESNAFQKAKSKLSAALGKNIAGEPVIANLAEMPHLLIAGTTGSGKSVCINSIIISILYKATPEDVRFLMIDPKAVELTEYNGMPHMLVPVVTDPRKASGALSWAVSEMQNRYKLFAEYNVRNLQGYNSLAEVQNYQDENGQPMPPMPQIVIVIDELADLMMVAAKEVEDSICRLAQLARAAGMHLVVATQRPSVDVVTGLIKANIPSRIALTVSNAIDSRTILDSGGAEKLLGKGDMLFAPIGANTPVRVQGCYMTDDEISSVVEFVKKSKAMEYDEEVIQEIERNAANTGEKPDAQDNDSTETDPMMDEAIRVVVEAGQASTSLLQRRLRLGYARAGRPIDEMEQLGVVGPHEGSKPRQVLMTYAQWMERNMQRGDPPAAQASGSLPEMDE